MRISIIISALLATMLQLEAQPVIRAGGVVNAASLAPSGLQNSGVAQGSQFAIFGTKIGPADAVQQTAFPYPTTDGLGGVTVKVTAGGTTYDAIMVSVSDTKVVAVLPSSVPVGTGQVSLTYSGTSVTAPIEVVATNFGIYTRSSSGSGPGVIRNLSDDGSAADNAITASARPGQRVAIIGTGLGAVSGDEAGGALPGDIAVADLVVMVGGQNANVVSKGRADCCAGVDQLVIETPAGLSGCFVSLAVIAGGKTSNFATMSIAPDGDCSDTGGFTTDELGKLRVQSEFSIGSISLSRSSTSIAGLTIGGVTIPATESNSESASGSFSKYKVDALLNSAGFGGNPSIGSCVVSIFTSFTSFTIDTQVLDAGPSLTLTGPKGTRQLNKMQGIYLASFGGPAIPGLPGGGQPFLDPGDYTVTGPGGADIGPFTAKITLGDPLVWTNRATVGNSGADIIARSSDVTVTWTGGRDSELVSIFGSTSLLNPQLSAAFRCLERAPVGKFTVPSWVLSAVPPSQNGILSLSLTGTDLNRFDASGVDTGIVSTSSTSSRTIAYR